MILAEPVWLLLLLPVAVGLWLWRAPTFLLQMIWIVLALLIVAAMTRPMILRPDRAGVVVVVADRSRSMPTDAQQRQQEAVDLLIESMAFGDKLAVVSYGQRVAVERAPDIGGFGGFVTDVDAEASNMADALDRALALIPSRTPGRIVLLSDGRWTGFDPISAAGRAAEQGVAIDYRLLGRSGANDVAIQRVDAPLHVGPSESYMLTAWVRCPISQKIQYELIQDNVRIASGEIDAAAGLNRLTFRDRAKDAGGTMGYQLRVTGHGSDPVPENNVARVLVGVDGPRPLLALTGPNPSAFIELLQRGGLNVETSTQQDQSFTIEALSNYAGIVLENVPAQRLGANGMQNVAAWVHGSGKGLLMTGGRQSFGPGGYFNSPLDPILPVSMELRQEHRKLAMAIVVVLDRSGSMTMPVGGKTKMDLANLGTAEVAELLSPLDELGVIAVDSQAHLIQDLEPVTDKEAIKNRVLRIQSMGGGIFVYTGLSEAVNMMSKATAQTRHIILFSDAADSEEPGRYVQLLEQCAKANITVSVIGLGKPTDPDADFLRDIALRGNGRIFFTDDAMQLPRLFAQDTFAVARSSFLDELTSVQTTAAMTGLLGRNLSGADLTIGGYNLCYLKDGAVLSALSEDEYKAPVIASWRAGTGRVAVYTGEVDGQYTGPIANWPRAGELFTSLGRWVLGEDDDLPNDMVITQSIRSGVYDITLHLDPSRPQTALKTLPTVTTLRSQTNQSIDVEEKLMQWTSPDTLGLSIPLTSDQTVLSSVSLLGVGQRTLSPVCLPYSPEFEPGEGDDGSDTLKRLADTTNGQERIQLAETWLALPKRPQFVATAHWLLVLAIVVLLLEVLERRTGLLSMIQPSRLRQSVVSREVESTEIGQALKPSKAANKKTKTKLRKKETTTVTSDDMLMLDALRQARSRANQRTQKDQ